MEKAFEHVLTRQVAGSEVRFTATPELVARETGINTPTQIDIRRWLNENADAAEQAAVVYKLTHPLRRAGSDGIVRLGTDDFPSP